MSVNGLLASHPMVRLEASLRERAVAQRFDRWASGHQGQPWVLSLFDFAAKRPLRYLSDDAIDDLLTLLESHPDETVATLRAQGRELSHGIHCLVARGSSWDRERLPSLSDPASYAEFEQVWFPEYQRYAEHAFNHLINLPLGVIERVRGKQYCSLALSQRADCLAKFGLPGLATGFSGPVRNAISHGNTEYGIAGIRFIDRSTTEEMGASEFLRLFDRTVSACNAMAAAMLLFMVRNLGRLDRNSIPLGASLMALRGASSYRNLSVERLIPVEILDGKTQLLVACSTSVASRPLQTFDAMHIAARAQDFGASSFDRIGVVFDSGRPPSGSIFLDAARLARARRDDEPLQALGEVVETSLLWHDSSNLWRRIHTARLALHGTLAQLGAEIRQRWRDQGATPLRFRYSVRHLKNTSAGSLRRLEGIVVLERGEDPSEEDLHRIVRHAVRRVRRKPIRSLDITSSGPPLRRPRYVWIKVFREDAVLRALEHPGPDNPNLILKAEWTSVRYRARPLFVRFPTKTTGAYRFEYPVRSVAQNLALLQGAVDSTSTTPSNSSTGPGH